MHFMAGGRARQKTDALGSAGNCRNLTMRTKLHAQDGVHVWWDHGPKGSAVIADFGEELRFPCEPGDLAHVASGSAIQITTMNGHCKLDGKDGNGVRMEYGKFKGPIHRCQLPMDVLRAVLQQILATDAR
jgi:hypothetical protein